MTTDTAIGGPHHRFPPTRPTVIEGMAHADEATSRRSYEAIVAAYWKPVYKYIRLRWHESNESAKDLTQSFFAKALETSSFTHYDPARSAFRTYLRVSVDGHVLNTRKFKTRAKRVGDHHALPLDPEIASQESPDALFHAEWVRNMVELALDDLGRDYLARNRSIPFQVFERYDLCEHPSRPSYAQLASHFSIDVTTVTNYLSAARRDLRRLVLQRLRGLTATEREFRAEARSLLGVDV